MCDPPRIYAPPSQNIPPFQQLYATLAETTHPPRIYPYFLEGRVDSGGGGRTYKLFVKGGYILGEGDRFWEGRTYKLVENGGMFWEGEGGFWEGHIML